MIIRKDPIVARKGPDGKKPKNMLFFASHQKEPICDRLCISFISVCPTYVFRQKYRLEELIHRIITDHKYNNLLVTNLSLDDLREFCMSLLLIPCFFHIITWQSIVNDLVNKRGSLDMLPQLAQEKMTLPIVVFTHYYENSTYGFHY